jgi:hypothetical protein
MRKQNIEKNLHIFCYKLSFEIYGVDVDDDVEVKRE